jgi:alpha-L-fucosidase
MGQRVIEFKIQTFNEDGTGFEIKRSTIGKKRIVSFPKQLAKSLRIYITEAKAIPLIGEVDAFMMNESLIEKD